MHNPHDRPRLFVDREWVNQFQEQLGLNQTVHDEWARFKASADKLLIEEFVDEQYADGENSQHGRYGVPGNQIMQMGMTFGAVYLVSGERKYAEKLRDALLYYSGYRKWHGKGLAYKDPAWHSELNTTRFCFGFAAGYDYIHDMLSEQEKYTIREALIRLGIKPLLDDWVLHESRIHALDSMGHNWWSVCVSHAGLAALTLLGDDESADGWLDEVLTAMQEYFGYTGSVLGNKSPNFDSKGAFYESVNYARYGLYEYLLFRLAYARLTGVRVTFDHTVLEQAGVFFINTVYPSSNRPLSLNFGDSHLNQGASDAVKLLLANGFEDPRLRWYLQLYQEPLDAFDFFFYDSIWNGESRPPSSEKLSVIYDQIGWAVMRSGWDHDETMLGVKSGFTWNHAHADAGSFVLFHQGMPMLIDSGTCSYSRQEYHDYYLQSKAHNVVLFNNKGQDEDDLHRGGKEPGQLYHMINLGGLQYVYADATGPMSRYLKRNYRHFLWLEGCILIYDDLLAHEEGRFQWLLHYEGAAGRLDNGDIQICNGAAKTLVRTLFPHNVTLTPHTGLADHAPDQKVSYYCLETPDERQEAKFLTAIIPQTSAQGLPEMHPLQGNEMRGVSICHRGKITDVCYNSRADGRVMHRNSINTLHGWDTDAYMIAVTRTADADADDIEAIERIFIGYGSFLRRNGVTLYASHSKATLAYAWHGKTLSIRLSGQPQGKCEITPLHETTSLQVNDSSETELMYARNGNIAFSYKSQVTSRRPG